MRTSSTTRVMLTILAASSATDAKLLSMGEFAGAIISGLTGGISSASIGIIASCLEGKTNCKREELVSEFKAAQFAARQRQRYSFERRSETAPVGVNEQDYENCRTAAEALAGNPQIVMSGDPSTRVLMATNLPEACTALMTELAELDPSDPEPSSCGIGCVTYTYADDASYNEAAISLKAIL